MSYYFSNDDTVKSEIKKHDVIINNTKFSFYTDNGVFSKKGLDFGTRALLESLKDVSGDVLDFGCGYGPIGIFIKKTFDTYVDMVDINKRSINLAIKNANLNNVTVNVFESNIYENVNKKYDYIISNPPIRVGKKILYDILTNAKNYLKSNGKMIFVVNKDQGAKSIIKDLEEYYNVEVLNKVKGFYIISLKSRWQLVSYLLKL